MERTKGEREEKRPNFLWLLLKKNFLNDFKGASTFCKQWEQAMPVPYNQCNNERCVKYIWDSRNLYLTLTPSTRPL